MKSRSLYTIGFCAVLFFAVVFMVRFLSGPEDSWICKDGQWQKHGNPSAEMPSTACK